MRLLDKGIWARRSPFIYAVMNERSGAVYVGASRTTVYKRYSAHVSALNGGKHKSEGLQADWSQYGDNAFRFEVLEVCPAADSLKTREEAWMITFAQAGWPLYNYAVPPACANKASYRRVGRKRRAASRTDRSE